MKLYQIIALLTSQQQKQKSCTGFTLIELLVVIMIATALSLVAIPSLLGQVGKAREAEAKQNLSSIGQAQQAYFFTKATFANDFSRLDVAVKGNYYEYPNPTTADGSKVKHQATAINPGVNATRSYSLGIYHDSSGQFGLVLCQGEVGGGLVEAPNTSTGLCINGTQVQ